MSTRAVRAREGTRTFGAEGEKTLLGVKAKSFVGTVIACGNGELAPGRADMALP